MSAPQLTEISTEKRLDSTLRYLYGRLIASEALLLAIRFTYRGQRYEADTPEEAKGLVDLLETAEKERAKSDPDFARKLLLEKAGWTSDKFWGLVNGIGEMQIKLLEAFLASGQYPVFADRLAATLGLKSQVSLAGVLSGFSKQAKRLGVRTTDVFTVNTYWKGKKKERAFIVSDGFLEVAKANCWPFTPLLKAGKEQHAASTMDTRK
jgi:hypothetical protein